jgi:radical SAM superfamily enzyme YgiQ (UPF0313 family)
MTTSNALRAHNKALLKDEYGTIFKAAQTHVTMLYPSPYRAGMSSLGYQLIYRLINGRDDTVAERAFLPDDPTAYRKSRVPLFTLESERPVGNSDIVAISLAYELELPGMLDCFDLAGLPLLARDRNRRQPLVVIGGPLTFSNPLPAAPFADVVIMGEGEETILQLLDHYHDAADRDDLLSRLAALPGFYVPAIHGERLVPTAAANNALLPAYSQIITPNTELSNMHLVESERGCHRKCTFCVMRRSTNGGMRLADPDAIIDSIPDVARRVGLVGAAVSDHPRLLEIVERIVDSGREIGLSSLRADRLSPELVRLLKRGGYRTLTVASDGASERLRAMMQKGTREADLLQSAHYAALSGMRYLKVYMMIGVPTETEADIAELIEFTRELATISPIALGIAPFVAKRNTPLDRQPFAGIKPVEAIMDRIQRDLRGVVDIRSTSPRWAWVEYALAQGGFDMTAATIDAWKGGGSFGAWKKAIAQHQRAEQPDDVSLRLGVSTARFAGELHPAPLPVTATPTPSEVTL